VRSDGFEGQQVTVDNIEFGLTNFKGIDFASVPLRGLTVLAGMNSSGKSSLIRSLLLFAQSDVDHLRMNGEVLIMGDAEELRNPARGEQELTFGFRFPQRSVLSTSRRAADLRLGLGPSEFRDPFNQCFPHEYVDIELNYQPDEFDSTRLVLASMKIWSAGGQPDITPRLIARLTPVPELLEEPRFNDSPGGDPDEEGRLTTDSKMIGAYTLTGYEGHTGPMRDIRIDIAGSEVSSVCKRASVLETFEFILQSIQNLPIETARTTARSMVEAAIESVVTTRYDTRSSPSRERPNKHRDDLTKELLDLAAPIEHATSKEQIADAINAVRRLTELRLKRSLVRLKTSRRMSSAGDFGQRPSASPFFNGEESVSIAVVIAALSLISWFASGIRYLGPLRAEARPAFGIEVSSRVTPLGLNGGSTAAFLSSAKAELSRRSAAIQTPRMRLRTQQRPLRQDLFETLAEDLKALGVGEDVLVDSNGRFGYELKVIKDGRAWNISDLGTGVSQVLPILVLLNTSPRGATVLIEQPELHLHPAMQSRLADLLLKHAAARTIIVETHSDYFLNRLRRRILESAVAEEACPTDFVWASQSEDGKGFVITPLATDKYGDIAEWPTGFFDVDQNDLDSILENKILLAENNEPL